MADQASGSTVRQPASSAGRDSSHSQTSSSRARGRGRGRGNNSRGGRQSTPIRSRHDTRDFADPSQIRGIIQSIEDSVENMRRDQRREQEELQTRFLQSQDTMMQMLQEIRREGRPQQPRVRPDTILDFEPDIPTPDDIVHDEVHPSIEKGVEFDAIGGTDDRPTTPRHIRQEDGADSESLQGDPVWTARHPTRNPSAPISNLMYGTPRLSKSVPESDSLDDGTDPTFTQWRASIRDKFRENADHFASERSRCTHVWLKTTGLARSYLSPRYTSTDRQFTSVSEILTCLETYFLTGTEKEEARNRYNDMSMQDKTHPQESFPEFKARFLADAIEGGVPESEWFFALWNKLLPRIRLQNLTVKDQWKENFSVMVQHLTRVEMERARPSNKLLPSTKVLTQTTKKSTNTANSRTSSSTPASAPHQPRSTPRPFQNADRSSSRQPVSTGPSRTTFERASSTPAKDQAKCYRCGEYGHFKSECPNPASINKVDGDLDQPEDTDNVDTEEVDEQTDETREGNGEA
jgi:Zinc knuckle